MEFTIKQGGRSGTFKNTDAGNTLPLTFLGPLDNWFRSHNTTGTIRSYDDIKDEPLTVSIRAGVWDWGSHACDLSSAKSDSVTISGCTNPKIVPSTSPSGSAAAVPTLGEVGLLLSGIALAGAAAPALRRRRERNEREQRSERKRA